MKYETATDVQREEEAPRPIDAGTNSPQKGTTTQRGCHDRRKGLTALMATSPSHFHQARDTICPLDWGCLSVPEARPATLLPLAHTLPTGLRLPLLSPRRQSGRVLRYAGPLMPTPHELSVTQGRAAPPNTHHISEAQVCLQASGAAVATHPRAAFRQICTDRRRLHLLMKLQSVELRRRGPAPPQTGRGLRRRVSER